MKVSTENSPASGLAHLVLDDSVDDAGFSVAEASLSVDLANKKNVVLSFKAKSLGNEPHAPPAGNFVEVRNYDGVAISGDGGTTWRSVQSLAAVGLAWESFSLTLDSAATALGGAFGQGFRIRFSQYDNTSAPLDGLAIDDVMITAVDDQRVVLEMPTPLGEGTGPHSGYVFLSVPPADPLTVALTMSGPGLNGVPASLVVPAGQTSASFSFSATDDLLVNLTRTLTITPAATGATATAATVTLYDNDVPPAVTLTLPAQVTEGFVNSNNASLAVAFPMAVPVTFSLSGNPASQITLPAAVTLPAGQTQVLFSAQATNDTLLDGSVPVTVTAAAAGLTSAFAETVTLDNDLQPLVLTLPATLTEGTATTATVSIANSVATDLTVIFSASVSGLLNLPTSVALPAGQTSVAFSISAVNDSLVNFSRTVTVNVDAVGMTRGTSSISILDDETAPALTLTLPAVLTEGASPAPSNNGKVTLSVAPAVAVVVSFSSIPSGELNLPSAVTVPAGQTQATFTVSAFNDSKLDGDVTVSVTASGSGLTPASAATTVVDNENRNLGLTLPATVLEGGSASGTITISGSLTTPLVVNLASDNGDAVVPAGAVTIPAGSLQASFSVVAGDNLLRDGSRNVKFSATAAGFTAVSGTLQVRDNELGKYNVTGLTDIVNLANPVAIVVAGADVDGNLIPNFNGLVNLSLILPDGSSRVVTPGTVVVAGATGWSGNVVLPDLQNVPLRLRASDASGNTGDSIAFDVMRLLGLPTADLIWDAARGRIYASVPSASGSIHANQVVAIDPATLQITASVTVNQDPGKLAITSGGEALYVALNGNGTVSKILLPGFTVASNFALGTSSYGTLYVEDMCTVAGQPNLLVVSQYRKSVSPRHNGVAVYDNGVIRSLKTQDHTGSNVIEPSADPAVFFGYNTESTEYGFRRLQLGATGITELAVSGNLISGFSNDIRAEGNTVFSNSGTAVNGALMKRLGTFPPTSGLVCPNLAANRVYFLEPQSQYSSTHDKIGAYDPTTFSTIKRLTLPSTFTPTGSFIRWGANGLAFRTASSVVLVSSSRLVPSDPPADLAVTVQATPNPASIGAPLTYTVQVTNQGPNIARNALVGVTLSDSQSVSNVILSRGTASLSGLTVSMQLGDFPSGASETLTITTIPQSAGSLTCTAGASSDAVDPDSTNNFDIKLVSVGFQAAINVVNQLRLNANNLIYDASRNLIWASIPGSVVAPLGKSVVSIDPLTGLISQPIPINAAPYAGSMALSSNGRYLYLGLSDVPEVHRIDLNTGGYPSLRIPLGLSQWGSANHAQDIEPLDGDGTSFLIAGSGDHAAAVYDGSVMRAARTSIYSVDRIERGGAPGIFIGYNNYTSGFDLTRLSVTAAGVAEVLNVSDVVSSYNTEIHNVGNLLLSSTGMLVNSDNLTLKANLGIRGQPCVDPANQRAYLVDANALRAFDTATGNATGSLTLPTTATGDWASRCIRWGLDGFAILGNDGKIYLARWSATIPTLMDSDADNISDAWEAAQFNSLGANLFADPDGDGIASILEYLFATSPGKPSPGCLQSSLVSVASQNYVRLVFPRRTGTPTNSYGYESSVDLVGWTTAIATETVLSTQTIDGTSVETVQALIPAPAAGCGYVRLKSKP